VQIFESKKRVAECSTIFASAPDAMWKSDKEGSLEIEKANVWRTRSSASGAMPKVIISRGPNINTSKMHMIHPSVQGEIPNIRIMYNDIEHSISIDFYIYISIFQVF
jgi:hypothetical protein